MLISISFSNENIRTENKDNTKIILSYIQNPKKNVDCSTEQCLKYNSLLNDKKQLDKFITSLQPESTITEKETGMFLFIVVNILLWIILFQRIFVRVDSKNKGSFGENVYKIGMTRRLEPMERIWELGDASVPFEFDVHAMIFCENAPELEKQLHSRFNDFRVNKVNERKEFFNVSLDEISKACKEIVPDRELKITMVAEAKEYNISKKK